MTMMTQGPDALARETIESLRRTIDPLLQKTKGNLFYQRGAGFLGSLLCKLEFQWTYELSTAAISATTLYWNPDFFEKLSKEMRITVLAHELWHNALMHTIRLNGRCPDIWNIAGDHVINNLLEDHGYLFENWMHPSEPNYQPNPWCKDPKYKGWSTDEVYDDLIAGGMKPHSGVTVIGLGKDVLPAESQDKDVAVANVVGAMATARMTNGAGDIPSEVTLIIDKFLNPKLPWETILFNFFNALTSEEYSYSRPNRRYEDPLVPGITGRAGLEHLIYYLDISGSITDEQILRFNSEVRFIQEELRPEKLTLVTFDTQIRDEHVFEKDDPFEKIVVTGRGGTDLREVFAHARREGPTAMIVFSDLRVRIPDNPGIPIIWVCVDNRSTAVPYGQLIYLGD
jgi:predicted metal-dependent peptidase